MSDTPGQKARLLEIYSSKRFSFNVIEGAIAKFISENEHCNISNVCEKFRDTALMRECTTRKIVERLITKGILEQEQHGNSTYIYLNMGLQEIILEAAAKNKEMFTRILEKQGNSQKIKHEYLASNLKKA